VAENQTLADLLRQKAQSVIDFPTTVVRNLNDPQAFLKSFGYTPSQQLSGFSAGYAGVPEQPPSDIGVLDPKNIQYNKGYGSGEEAGLITAILGGTTGLASLAKKTKGLKNESGKGFFDTGDIRRVGKHQPNINPLQLSPDELRAVQGNIEIPNLRRDISSSFDQIIKNPELNSAFVSAKKINPNFNLEIVKAMPPSSLQKQFPIAKTYEEMVKGIEPTLQAKMFAQYLRMHPEAVKKSGATNYSELIPASYEQLGKENAQQLDRMLNQGMNLSYHKGDLNYTGSPQMLEDALLNKHLYTFGGGQPHELLNKIDPYTGLNQNQVFRAVHDYYGHGPTGASFGPKGEELAFGSHSQLYSPLAKMAAATETRGQNSFVNYSGINAELQKNMMALKVQQERLARAGQDTSAIDAKLAELGSQMQYAEQKAFLLPPEMIDLNYKGGVPDYLKPYLNPNNPSSATGYHFSNSPELTMTDPSRYGTGITGKEANRLKMADALRDRTYFYTNPAMKEPGLGINQYQAELNNLYDINKDPDKLNVLSKIYNQYQGILDKDAYLNALERTSNQAGYKGILTEDKIINFEPQIVKPVKKE